MNNMIKYSSLALILTLVNQSALSAYDPDFSVGYAKTNYNVKYGPKTNPFIDVGNRELGGNCTNFVNQSISAGLLKTKSPISLNKEFIAKTNKAQHLNNTNRYYYKNIIGNKFQSSTWRGAQSMFSYSRASSNKPNSKGVNLTFVTKTAYVNGVIQPLDYSKIRNGDIVFFDFDFKKGGVSNKVDHAAIVTKVNPKRWYDLTQKMKYNNIRLTYQTRNRDNVGLGEVIDSQGEGVAYVYRPV